MSDEIQTVFFHPSSLIPHPFPKRGLLRTQGGRSSPRARPRLDQALPMVTRRPTAASCHRLNETPPRLEGDDDAREMIRCCRECSDLLSAKELAFVRSMEMAR